MTTPVTDCASARALFAGAQRNIYMNVSVRGLLSTPVRDAVSRFLDDHESGDWDKAEMFETVERARERFATLIGAHPDEVALTKNTSDALNAVATALPWAAGDNLVICPDLEHPNNVYPWLNLRDRHGVEVRAVAPRDGHIPAVAMIDAMDDRTRLVTLSTVTFSPGFVSDVPSVARACRRRGVFCLVDAAQSVGVLHTDVRALEVDGLAVATQKGLLAFYGLGFLYCRREWADRLAPAALARFGVDFAEGAHETAVSHDAIRYAPAARRFDLGNYNYLGATAADAALHLIGGIGTVAIETHVRALAARFAEGLRELDLPVCGGAAAPQRGHIVAVGQSGGGRHDTADDPAMNDLYRYLADRGVKLAIRRGVLRFSLHLYNNDDDIDRVLAMAAEWRSARS